MGLRILSTWGGSWTGQTATSRLSFGTPGRPTWSGNVRGSQSGGMGRSHECPPCLIDWWSRKSSSRGGYLGFVRGDAEEAGGGTRRFTKADNGEEDGALGGQDLAAGVSREGT